MLEDRGAGGDEGGEAGGLSGLPLAMSCWRAMRQARDGVGLAPAPAELTDCGQEIAVRFIDAVRYLEREIEGSGEAGGSFSGAARGMVRFLFAEGEDPDATLLITLEAAARHATNVMDFDPSEDGRVEDHEVQWRQWASQRAGLAEPPPSRLGDGDEGS